MFSVCLPSDALLQHLPSYLGFSYLGRGVSLHSCSSKAQLLLLTLDEGYLLTAAIRDIQRGMAPLGPPVPMQPPTLGLLLPATAPGLQRRVAPQGHQPWPQRQGGFSRPPLTSDAGCLLPAATDLGCGVALLGCLPWPGTQSSSSQLPPLTSDEGCLLPADTDLARGVAPPGGLP